MTKRVCFFVYDETNFLTLAGLLEAFAALTEIQKEKQKTYALHVCSYTGGNIPGGYECFIKTQSVDAHANTDWDTLIICGGWGFEQALQNHQLIRCVADQARRARRLCVVGGGAFVAAAAGLLDDRRVAAHPIIASRLRDRFPRLQVDSKALLIRDGDVLTSPGMASAVDLALSLIESDINYLTAIEVAKFLVVPMKRSFHDRQVSADLVIQEQSDKFGPLHDWIRSNLSKRLSLEDMAGQAAMSVRNFTRVYQAEIGISPRKVVEIIRVHAGCRALTLGGDRVKSVARRCGFGSERTFLRAFTRIVGVPPNVFRAIALGEACGGAKWDRAIDPHNIDLSTLIARAAEDQVVI